MNRPMSQVEVAALFGVSRQAISLVERRGLAKLRRALEKRYRVAENSLDTLDVDHFADLLSRDVDDSTHGDAGSRVTGL